MRDGGRISEEPIINFVHRRLPALLLAGFVLLVVYCSLIPFDFGPPQLVKSRAPTFLGLSVRVFNLPDIMLNIALYVPMGAGIFLVLRHSARNRVLSFALAILSSAAISFLIEQAQAFERSRVASWADFVANSLGGILGTVFAVLAEAPIRLSVAEMRRNAAQNWWLAVSKILVCVVLLIQLRPFDLATDPRKAAKTFLREAELSPLSRWTAIPKDLQTEAKAGRRSGSEVSRAKYEYLLDRIIEAALFAAVAATSYAGLMRGGATRTGSALASGLAVHTLATSIMLIRIFLSSRGFDSSILPCATIGWLTGFAVAAPAVSRSRKRADHRIDWPPIGKPVAFVLVLTLISLYCLVPFDLSSNTREGLATRAGFFPFKGLMASHASDAFMSISGDLLRFAAMGAALAWAIGGLRLPLTMLICASVTCIFSCATEALHLLMPSRHCDVTHVILAAIGSISGAIGYRWVIDLRESIGHVEMDDLLTGRLIDGATYRPIEITSPNSVHSDVFRTGQVESRPIQ